MVGQRSIPAPVPEPLGSLARLDDVRHTAPGLLHLPRSPSVQSTGHWQTVEPLEFSGRRKSKTFRVLGDSGSDESMVARKSTLNIC